MQANEVLVVFLPKLLCVGRFVADQFETGDATAFLINGQKQLAGNMTPHTELACEVYCGLSSGQAAAQLDNARSCLPAVPAYELWRQRTEELLTVPGVGYQIP